jgi:thiamine pyrophosphate-dependent acetolactate synthase large subunit-like protein
MTDKLNEGQPNGAQLVVRALEAQGVTHVFGIPGAKIDAVFNALIDSKIQTVVCRHEQNPVIKEALNHVGPIIVGVLVHYSDNHKLFEMVKEDRMH